MTAQVTWPYPCPQPHEHDLVRVPSRIADSYLPILRGGKAQNGRIGLKKRRNWRHFAGCCHDAFRWKKRGEGVSKVGVAQQSVPLLGFLGSMTADSFRPYFD